MSDARDLRADTALTRDPANPSRFRGEINEGWKVVYVFGGVTMYTALRAMQEALNRPELPLVTANAIYLAPVPPGPITIDVEVLRDGRRASQVAADLRVDDSDQVALRVHGVFGAAHDTDLTFQEVRCPEVPRPQDSPEPPTDRPNPFGHIPFHEQTLWRPVSPLDDPGRGQFLSWVRLARDADPDLLTLAVHGDVLGPAVGRGIGPVHGAVARDRHPVRRDAGHPVGLAGDRGVARRRRLRDRSRALVGRARQALRDRDPDRQRPRLHPERELLTNLRRILPCEGRKRRKLGRCC